MAKPVENKEEKNPNSKKNIELSMNQIIIITSIIIIISMIIGFFITYCALESSMSKKFEQVNQEEQVDEEEGDEKQEGIIFDLGDSILNLADAGQRRYLKVGVAMELSKTEEELAQEAQPQKASGHGEAPAANNNDAIIAEMERYKSAIRDAVISVLSSKTSDELLSPTGKEMAKEEITEMVNNIFEGEREVLRVSFGQFIIQ